MRRLFVIIPAMLLLATFACIAWHSSDRKQIIELRERIEILERHLDSTGE